MTERFKALTSLAALAGLAMVTAGAVQAQSDQPVSNRASETSGRTASDSSARLPAGSITASSATTEQSKQPVQPAGASPVGAAPR